LLAPQGANGSSRSYARRFSRVTEIQTDSAQQTLIILKSGIKRPRRGLQSTRYQELRKHTLVDLGRRVKAQRIAEGTNATLAHEQASENAGAEGARYGLSYTAGHLAREMDTAKQ
jgi:hypothetical protein